MIQQLIDHIKQNKTPTLIFVKAPSQEYGIIEMIPLILAELQKIEGYRKINHSRSSVIDVNNGTQQYEIIVTTEKGITLRSKDKEHVVYS